MSGLTESLDGFAVMRRNGDIFTVAVDPKDFERVEAAGPWRVVTGGRTFYAARDIRSSSGRWTAEFLHQFLLDAKGIDHIDGNGLHNCKINLRLATQAQNIQNRRGLSNHNTSGYRGVCFDKQTWKWRASVMVDGHYHHLGRFATAAEAGVAASNGRARLMPFSADARENQ